MHELMIPTTDSDAGGSSKPAKMSATKTKDSRRANLRLDPRTDRRIARIRARYEEMLGQPVSTTIAVRRAVDLLDEHLKALEGEHAVALELSRLCYAVR